MPLLTTVFPLLAVPDPEPTSVEEAVPAPVQESAEGTVEAFGPVIGILFNIAVGVLSALAVVVVVALILNVVLSRRPQLRQQIAQCRVPVAVALSILASRIALGLTSREESWFPGVSFVLLIGIVAALGWLALRVVRIVEEQLLVRYQAAGVDDRRERKIRTQTMLLRRILNAVIIVIAVSVILLAIPSVRAVGAGLLASAGVLSVVAGLAVQSTLTNVFAGVQLAFTDGIRVGDVVDMEDTFGTIEEITLSSVVVKIWDGRRMIYPSSHFTTTPFENWTRTGSALSGTVEMDVDWDVPLEAMRERLRALLDSTELWDGRECSMQVTDALGGMVRIRAVVSARSSGDLWDLRCLVREDFVTFLHADHPEGIYTQRMVEAVPVGLSRSSRSLDGEATAPQQPQTPQSHDGGTAPETHTSPLSQVRGDSSVFTGSITAVERNREFSGPGESAYQERRERAERAETGSTPTVTGELPVTERGGAAG